MAVSTNQFTPYLSAVLFASAKSSKAFAVSVRKEIKRLLIAATAIDSSDKIRSFKVVNDDIMQEGQTVLCVLLYSENKSPAWLNGDALKDLTHQCVIISVRDGYLALSFSDPGARNSIVSEIKKSKKTPLNKLKLIGSQELENSLVDDGVKSLWLAGTHRQTAIKPDGKALTGGQLEFAIDPLGDSSYFYSSIRSKNDNQAIAYDGKPPVVGVSLREGRFWISPTRSWDEFAERIGGILAHVATNAATIRQGRPGLDALAQPVSNLSGVAGAYGIALTVPENQLADKSFDEDGEDRWFQQFADIVRFELEPDPNSSNFNAKLYWEDEELGELSYSFETIGGVETKIVILGDKWKPTDERGKALKKIATNPRNITVYFDTGHTFAQGRLYLARFRDPGFEDWEWVEMASDETAFHKEKPNRVGSIAFAPERIGDADDKSLFGLVARHWPNLANRGNQTGWLICDDGAMESADFIHIDVDGAVPKLTLIHVKGSGSKSGQREYSTTDYEVVVGQAVKNLRHLDNGILFDKIDNNKDGQLSDAVWHDGERQNDRTEVLNILNSLGANYEKKVVILQPRVRRTDWEAGRASIAGGNQSTKRALRLKQLDTLLQGARSACANIGASFVVIGDHDDY